jgi:hypothetical protein
MYTEYTCHHHQLPVTSQRMAPPWRIGLKCNGILTGSSSPRARCVWAPVIVTSLVASRDTFAVRDSCDWILVVCLVCRRTPRSGRPEIKLSSTIPQRPIRWR